MVELFVAGQLVGATGIPARSAHCSWQVVAPGWELKAGADSGRSHLDTPACGGGHFVWQQPINIRLEGDADKGWPRLQFEVRSVDEHGRSDVAGYAMQLLPTFPGSHSLHCSVWRPRGSLSDRISAFFLGASPHLKESDLIFGIIANAGAEMDEEEATRDKLRLERASSGHRLTTVGGGTLHLLLHTCMRTPPEGGGHALPIATPARGRATSQ